MMTLTEQEKAMLAGAEGEPRRLAMEHMVQVAGFFDAEDLVPVGQVHVMADSEALGEPGTAFLERLASAPEAERRVRVPTVTDPRGADFKAYERLRCGELDPQDAFLSNQIRVEGDMAMAMQLALAMVESD